MLQAYGFIGIIETVTSFAMSFWYLQRNGIPFSSLWFQFNNNVPDDLLAEASSIYFINLVVMQWFNLLAVRTRRLSIIQHPPLFNENTQNWYLFPAIAFSLCMAIFWLYVPQLQSVLGTSQVPAEHFFLPAAFGLGILMLDELRKYCVRRWPNSILAKTAW
jgi:sodium/potassium-transporting ATPase subunit alpha